MQELNLTLRLSKELALQANEFINQTVHTS